MSAPAPSAVPTVRARESLFTRLRNFWQRVSEGRQIDDLWTQFAADARASYGFYGSDVDWERIKKLPRWRRPLHVARGFFWALILKMSPARRVLLLIALVCLSLAVFGDVFIAGIRSQSIAAVLLLMLLALELADKVIMKRDLEIAREIQTWLVPAAPPSVSGADIAFATRPQNSVAGDYYDAFFPSTPDPQNDKLMLVIADVAGKSVPAALLMATLQASLRTIASEDAPLADLVARLNRYACAHSMDGRRFTTAVLAQFEPPSCRLTYVNAGHNPPILRRANGTLEKLETGGLPLGILASAVHETATVSLAPNDTLIFYTDGVVEAFDEDGQEFGDARWQTAIRALPNFPAQDALRYLMAQVDMFVGATRQSDDITCMVFHCTPRPPVA